MLYQQDDATCNTSRATLDVFLEKFRGRIISHHVNFNWPTSSYDLTLLIFSTSRVFIKKSATLKYLKINIRQVKAEITQETYKKVVNKNLLINLS